MAYSLKNVIKGALTFTGVKILISILGFFLIPLYTRFLTPADYGITGYVEVLAQLLSTILMFGLYGAQTRFFHDYKDDKQEIGSFLFSINIYIVIVLLIVCGFTTFCGETIYKMLIPDHNIPFSPYFPVVVWQVFFQILNHMIISFYLVQQKFRKCAYLQVIQFFYTTGSIILFVVYLRQGASGKLKGILCGNLLFFLSFYWKYAQNFYYRFSFTKLKQALAFGIPIVIHLLSVVIHNSIDRIILERFVSLQELGVYTLGYQLGMVMSIVISSINQAWVPNYYDLMKDEMLNRSYHIKRVFYLWLFGIGTICLIGSIWSKEILILLTPQRFHPSAAIVPIILFSYVFQGIYFFAVNPLFFFKKTTILPFITGSSALLNISLNFLFIPKLGIIGAAYATVISFIYMAIVVYLISKRFFDPEYNLLKIFLVIIGLFLGSIIIDFQRVSIAIEFIKLGIVLGFVGMNYLLFRQYVQPLLKNRRKAI